jgi:hypothetical protein
MAYPTFHTHDGMLADEISAGMDRAESQETLIRLFFLSYPLAQLTPPEVQEKAAIRGPLTSIRRALTNLTRRGFLVKNKAVQKPGLYGMHNATWQLSPLHGGQA